jgi:hypothetical protein
MDEEKHSDRARDGKVAEFVELLRSALAEGSFTRLTLGCWRGSDTDVTQATARLVETRAGMRMAIVTRRKTSDTTEIVPVDLAPEAIRAMLDGGFRAGRLFGTARDAQLDWNQRSGATLTTMPPTGVPGQFAHDRSKRRMVPQSAPFLKALGVANPDGRVLPSMSGKWKQINKFVEILDSAVSDSALCANTRVKVADFGAGKGYLTFACHHHLRRTLGKDADVTGIERRADLVAHCNGVVSRLGLDGLRFIEGDLSSFSDDSLDMVIALHACDTATDEAIALGVRGGAGVIMCAPCCHKEIRPQMGIPTVLRPVLRFGIHAAQEAEMLTDSIRALLLEASGYAVNIFEFISQEHTDKNKMILGVKRTVAGGGGVALERLQELKSFYGIGEQRLENLLGLDGRADRAR